MLLASVLVLALAPAGAGARATCPQHPTTWSAASRSLSLQVLRPSDTGLLSLTRVVLPHASCGGAALDARYAGPGGRRLRLVEGPPDCCGRGGDAPVVARPRVLGRRAWLYAFGDGAGGRGFTLYVTIAGTEVGLSSAGMTARDLLRVARGLRAVPTSPPATG